MRTSSISRLVHPGRAALISVVLFGILMSGSSLMESKHIKCHALVVERFCLGLVVRFDRHAAGTDNRPLLTPHSRLRTHLALQSHFSSCNGA